MRKAQQTSVARRNILFLPTNYYHIYNRGAHKNNIFRNDADYMHKPEHIAQCGRLISHSVAG